MKPQRPHHPAVLAVAGLLSLAVGIGIGRFAYTPILPYMIAGLELDRSQAGLIASANYLGYFVGALAAAWRAVPGDPRFWLLGALALSGLSTGAMALTTSLGAFLLLRFVGGAAGALVMVLASSLVMDRLAAAGRDGWAAVMYAGVGSGIAVSSLAVPAAASGDSDWQEPVVLLRCALPCAFDPGRGAVAEAARAGDGGGAYRDPQEESRPAPLDPRLRAGRLRLRHHRHLRRRHGARRSRAATGGAPGLALRRPDGGTLCGALGLGRAALGKCARLRDRLPDRGGGRGAQRAGRRHLADHAGGRPARRDLRGVDRDRPHRDPPPVRRRPRAAIWP